MSKCYLLLGTNLNDKVSNMEEAAREISIQVGDVLTKSSIYLTAAWGKNDQEDFLNQVLCIETQHKPVDVMNLCLQIENDMGRVRFEKWGSRLIDIDVLFYESEIVDLENCKIPHPEVQNRRFTLEPLDEIAPNLNHPIVNKTIKELLEICPDQLDVTKLE
ncbi:MAG: 2-amino-4-hydroxy-6-hydroxymethyldihydropteridine diphosphokinase [Reichenbachiella sp.]